MDNLMTGASKPKLTPKDFFLHLGVMATLYAVIIALLNLLFRVINVAYPQVNWNNYYQSSSISLQVAVLIIVFPLLVLLAIFVGRSYRREPEKRQLWVRRWLWMLTLFVAGIALVADLITLLYYFLDGRELTTAFLLKVLAVLVVTAGVFGYVLQDLRDRLTSGGRRIWTIVTALALLVAIVLGFAVIGSPQSQRLRRYDDQKVNDLANIQSQVINYWQTKGRLPKTLAELRDPLSGFTLPLDPQMGKDYVYKLGEGKAFELCANFNLESQKFSTTKENFARPYYVGDPMSENWQHSTGQVCFKRVIDPELYPVNQPRPVKVVD